MSDVHKLVELNGTSPNSIEEAIENAIARASETIDELQWFEVTDMRGRLKDGKVDEYQITIKVGFRIKSANK